MKHPRRAKTTERSASITPLNSGCKKTKGIKFNKRRYFAIIFTTFAVLAIIVGICLGCDFTNTIDNGGSELFDDNPLVPVDKKAGKVNVLLLGVDIEGLRTDSMMVVSYDIDDNKINLLSIPRDTRMYIGTKYQKINAAHAIGSMKGKMAGPEGSVEAVTRLTGIPINYYLEFSFGAIDNFINALGGIDFEVPDVEGKGRGMNYDDPVQSLHIHLKPGMQHLNGNQVQQLLRYRKSNTKGLGYAEGDRGRVEMQQKFLQALVDQKFNASTLLKLPDIIMSIKQGIKTNMSISEMTKYAKYLTKFSSENLSAYQLPGEGNGTDYGASYWICDLEATKTLIEDVFGYDASNITIDSPDGSSKSKDKKTSESSKDSGLGKKDSSKTSKSTSAPKNDIPDNSDEEDYTSTVVKVTNPPTTKSPTKKPQKDNDDDDDEKTDTLHNSDNDESPEKHETIKSSSAPKKTEAPSKEDLEKRYDELKNSSKNNGDEDKNSGNNESSEKNVKETSDKKTVSEKEDESDAKKTSANHSESNKSSDDDDSSSESSQSNSELSRSDTDDDSKKGSKIIKLN